VISFDMHDEYEIFTIIGDTLTDTGYLIGVSNKLTGLPNAGFYQIVDSATLSTPIIDQGWLFDIIVKDEPKDTYWFIISDGTIGSQIAGKVYDYYYDDDIRIFKQSIPVTGGNLLIDTREYGLKSNSDNVVNWYDFNTYYAKAKQEFDSMTSKKTP